MLKVYLAGAIRDNHPEDIEWRKHMITKLESTAVFLNPLAGKVFDAETKLWSLGGISSSAHLIVSHDFWSIDHVDAAVFNFTSLLGGYPSIGTLIEFGRSTACSVLRYTLIDKDYRGHGNTGMYKLHPFIEQNSTEIFHDLDTMISFLSLAFKALSGRTPHYGNQD